MGPGSPYENFTRHVRRSKARERVEEADAGDFMSMRNDNFLEAK